MRFKFLVLVALSTPLAFATTAREVSGDLHHADGGYLPNAHGGVNIRDGSDFQRFTVTVGGAGDGVTLTVQIAQHDQFSTLGAMSPAATGLVFNVTTQNGGQLPLGATSTTQLSGDALRVVDGDGHPILVGVVPSFPTGDGTGGTTTGGTGGTTGGDGGGTTTPPATTLTARADLLRPDGGPDANAVGVIVVTKRADSEAFRCETGHLDPDTNYVLYFGDHDTATAGGDFTTGAEGGGVFLRDTATGAPLPGGVHSLADLAGKHVEIRDHAGDVVLFGAVPQIETTQDVAPVHTDSTEHDATSGADVHVVVDIRPHDGHETITVDMAHLPTHDSVYLAGGGTTKAAGRRPAADVYMDDGTGTFELIGSSRVNARGRARLRFATRRGGKLPLGAATLRELAGRALQVRVDGAGTLVSGVVPNF